MHREGACSGYFMVSYLTFKLNRALSRPDMVSVENQGRDWLGRIQAGRVTGDIEIEQG
jgi:hypothetical protein